MIMSGSDASPSGIIILDDFQDTPCSNSNIPAESVSMKNNHAENDGTFRASAVDAAACAGLVIQQDVAHKLADAAADGACATMQAPMLPHPELASLPSPHQAYECALKQEQDQEQEQEQEQSPAILSASPPVSNSVSPSPAFHHLMNLGALKGAALSTSPSASVLLGEDLLSSRVPVSQLLSNEEAMQDPIQSMYQQAFQYYSTQSQSQSSVATAPNFLTPLTTTTTTTRLEGNYRSLAISHPDDEHADPSMAMSLGGGMMQEILCSSLPSTSEQDIVNSFPVSSNRPRPFVMSQQGKDDAVSSSEKSSHGGEEMFGNVGAGEGTSGFTSSTSPAPLGTSANADGMPGEEKKLARLACMACIRGHRAPSCKHTDRPLFPIRPRGRPSTQCPHCKEARRSCNVNVKCLCGHSSAASTHVSPSSSTASSSSSSSSSMSYSSGSFSRTSNNSSHGNFRASNAASSASKSMVDGLGTFSPMKEMNGIAVENRWILPNATNSPLTSPGSNGAAFLNQNIRCLCPMGMKCICPIPQKMSSPRDSPSSMYDRAALLRLDDRSKSHAPYVSPYNSSSAAARSYPHFASAQDQLSSRSSNYYSGPSASFGSKYAELSSSAGYLNSHYGGFGSGAGGNPAVATQALYAGRLHAPFNSPSAEAMHAASLSMLNNFSPLSAPLSHNGLGPMPLLSSSSSSYSSRSATPHVNFLQRDHRLTASSSPPVHLSAAYAHYSAPFSAYGGNSAAMASSAPGYSTSYMSPMPVSPPPYSEAAYRMTPEGSSTSSSDMMGPSLALLQTASSTYLPPVHPHMEKWHINQRVEMASNQLASASLLSPPITPLSTSLSSDDLAGRLEEFSASMFGNRAAGTPRPYMPSSSMISTMSNSPSPVRPSPPAYYHCDDISIQALVHPSNRNGYARQSSD